MLPQEQKTNSHFPFPACISAGVGSKLSESCTVPLGNQSGTQKQLLIEQEYKMCLIPQNIYIESMKSALHSLTKADIFIKLVSVPKPLRNFCTLFDANMLQQCINMTSAEENCHISDTCYYQLNGCIEQVIFLH